MQHEVTELAAVNFLDMQSSSWITITSILLSLRFNGRFPGEPGLAGVY